jgi:hypothetical protein
MRSIIVQRFLVLHAIQQARNSSAIRSIGKSGSEMLALNFSSMAF